MSIDPNKLQNLLREVRTIKAYSIRVEGMLEEVLGGVGTAQKSQKRLEAKKEKIREEVKMRFLRPYNRKSISK